MYPAIASRLHKQSLSPVGPQGRANGARQPASRPATGNSHEASSAALQRLADNSSPVRKLSGLQRQADRQRLSNRVALQMLRADSRSFIRLHGLGIPDRLEDVQAYVWNPSNPEPMRLGLRQAWNMGQNPGGRFFISEHQPAPPELTPELLALLFVLISEHPGDDFQADLGSGAVALPSEFAHFNTGEGRRVLFDEAGALMDVEERRSASKNKRRDILKSLGIGEHVAAGHFSDDATLKSQALMGKPNFTFASDQALLSVIETGRQLLSTGTEKSVQFAMPPGLGHGYIVGSDGNLYRVEPKEYRVVRKAKGDFNTAYGVTEFKDIARFAEGYYSAKKEG